MLSAFVLHFIRFTLVSYKDSSTSTFSEAIFLISKRLYASITNRPIKPIIVKIKPGIKNFLIFTENTSSYN